MEGGGQERNRRGGTENVAGHRRASGAPRRSRRTSSSAAWAERGRLRDRLERGSSPSPTTPRESARRREWRNTTNIAFGGADGESLLLALDLQGVAVSTGAACAAGAAEPSHVLRAMGMSPDRVESSLRFSLGTTTTADEVDEPRPSFRAASSAGAGPGPHPPGHRRVRRSSRNRRRRRGPASGRLRIRRRCTRPGEPARPRGRRSARGGPTRRGRSRGRERTAPKLPKLLRCVVAVDGQVVRHSAAGTAPR